LTFDLTVNPDFAQVEADQQVLNLSTYETYYPEKRPFFLEGAELFAAPIQVLYTRRIGHVPDSPALRTASLHAQYRNQSRLWGAGKLTGTAGTDTQIGALAAITGGRSRHDRRCARNRTSALRIRGRATPRCACDKASRARYIGAFSTASRGSTITTIRPPAPTCCAPTATWSRSASAARTTAIAGGIRWALALRSPARISPRPTSRIGRFLGGAARMQRDGIVIASGDTGRKRGRVAREDNGPVFDVTTEATDAASTSTTPAISSAPTSSHRLERRLEGHHPGDISARATRN